MVPSICFSGKNSYVLESNNSTVTSGGGKGWGAVLLLNGSEKTPESNARVNAEGNKQERRVGKTLIFIKT